MGNEGFYFTPYIGQFKGRTTEEMCEGAIFFTGDTTGSAGKLVVWLNNQETRGERIKAEGWGGGAVYGNCWHIGQCGYVQRSRINPDIAN